MRPCIWLTLLLGFATLLPMGCERSPTTTQPAAAPSVETPTVNPAPPRTPAERIEDRHQRREARRDARRPDIANEPPATSAPAETREPPSAEAQDEPLPEAQEPTEPEPIDGEPQMVVPPSEALDPTFVAHPLRWRAPETWTKLGGGRTFRKATYVLPRADGDRYDGELAVWYFGDRVEGVVEANLSRWKMEFSDEADRPINDDQVGMEAFDVGELHVRVYSIAGRYRMRDFATETIAAPRDGYALRVAVVETPHGPWIFRALGPAKTLAGNDDRLRAMLLTVEE